MNKDSVRKSPCLKGCKVFFWFFVATCQIGQASSKIPQGLVQWEVPYYSPYVLVVDKGKKQISLWERKKGSTQRFLTFNVDVGKKKGDKFEKGDFKTPEGIYFLTQKFVGEQLISYKLYGSLAFDTNYPNFFDRRRRKTGAGIWIHGLPNTQALGAGSRGCIALNDRDIHVLKKYIRLHRTPLIIYDSVPMVSASQAGQLRKKLNQMVRDWQQSWENKQLDTYMDFYGSTFVSQKKNRDQWRIYKQGLMNKYQFIKLSLTQPLILHHPSGAVVKTLQRYESNEYRDFGEKTLYLVQRNKEFKIVGEKWEPLKSKKVPLSFSDYKEESNLPSSVHPHPAHPNDKSKNNLSLQTDIDEK